MMIIREAISSVAENRHSVTIPQTKKRDPSPGLYPSKEANGDPASEVVCIIHNVTPNMPD
jgi:hypothetical protein